MNIRSQLGKIISIGLLSCSLSGISRAQVSNEQIVHADRQPQNWLTYSGDYGGNRYSELKQIDATNVARLAPAWMFQTSVAGKIEATPLVIDGILYFTGADDHGYAVDARTGRTIWHYTRPLPARLPVCCGRVNRGFAARG